jgi:3-hydroxyacyl-[acyl-carrier protein] dehydratase/trans-2-decenoyl-[acyl-carrier protein] isomerase
VAARLASAKLAFRGQITPKTKLVTYEIHPKRVIQRKLHMIVADGITKADGVTIYTAKDLKVGLFSPEQLEAQMKP